MKFTTLHSYSCTYLDGIGTERMLPTIQARSVIVIWNGEKYTQQLGKHVEIRRTFALYVVGGVVWFWSGSERIADTDPPPVPHQYTRMAVMENRSSARWQVFRVGAGTLFHIISVVSGNVDELSRFGPSAGSSFFRVCFSGANGHVFLFVFHRNRIAQPSRR